ncbi:hypothetical protein [Streptosporangium sp. OZ121]|uniref:hypothetical protein n=1 Tax=Streptosporangium sp. OZ121 TaxID=3444183 RepID=UPI003F7AB737
MTSLMLSPFSSAGTADEFRYQILPPPPGGTRSRRRRPTVSATSQEVCVVVQGPWSKVVSNAQVAGRELTLEEEFDLVADDTFTWAEENLPVAAETWMDE